MPYFDVSKPIPIQIRDRLRDLLEADARVREVYPRELMIGKIPKPDVSKEEGVHVALAIFGNNWPIAIGGKDGRTGVGPRLTLTVKIYADNDDPDVGDQGDAQDELIGRTSRIVGALLRYQSDPGPGVPGQPCALWEAMEFDPQATIYRKMPGKWWASDTLFQLFSDQGNGQL